MSKPRSLVEQLDAKSLIPYQYGANIPLFIIVLCWFVIGLVKEEYKLSAISLLVGVYVIFAMCQPMGSFHYWIAVTLRLMLCVFGIMGGYDEFNKKGRLDGWEIAWVWILTYPIVWIMDLAIILGVSHPALVWIWLKRHVINIGIYGSLTLAFWIRSERDGMIVFLCITIFEIVQLFYRGESGVIKIGKIIYNQNERLGGGASSTVYRGKYDNKVAAVKKVNKDCLKDPEREKTILRQLDHENVIQCFGQEEDKDFLYLALSLCRIDFAQMIEDPMICQLDIITLLEQATKGIKYIHSRTETKDIVAHRDLKPQNIFLYEDQQTGQQRVMIGDFGLSKKSQPDASYVSIQTGCGTRGWKAPEMMELEQSNVAQRKVNVLSDIFPLGCLFYFMLTNGRHPFQKTSQPEIFREHNIYNDDYSLEDLDEEQFPHSRALIQKMISRNPKDRPSATEILSSPMFTMQDRPRILSSFLKWICPTKNCASIEGHSCRFVQSYHSNVDVTFFRSVDKIIGKDWVKKIRNRLANGTISLDEVVVVLSGTHGAVTALTKKAKAEPNFLHEDQHHIRVLKKEFPNHREIELVDVSAFHQKQEDLKKRVFSLKPNYIVLAFCNSNSCECDVKQLFFKLERKEAELKEKLKEVMALKGPEMKDKLEEMAVADAPVGNAVVDDASVDNKALTDDPTVTAAMADAPVNTADTKMETPAATELSTTDENEATDGEKKDVPMEEEMENDDVPAPEPATATPVIDEKAHDTEPNEAEDKKAAEEAPKDADSTDN